MPDRTGGTGLGGAGLLRPGSRAQRQREEKGSRKAAGAREASDPHGILLESRAMMSDWKNCESLARPVSEGAKAGRVLPGGQRVSSRAQQGWPIRISCVSRRGPAPNIARRCYALGMAMPAEHFPVEQDDPEVVFLVVEGENNRRIVTALLEAAGYPLDRVVLMVARG